MLMLSSGMLQDIRNSKVRIPKTRYRQKDTKTQLILQIETRSLKLETRMKGLLANHPPWAN